jgi:hypothetical protein
MAETTNLKLQKPVDADTTWGDDYRGAMDIIDENPGVKVVADNTAKTALSATSWEGRLCYQLDNNMIYKYNGASWEELGALESLALADFAEDPDNHSGLDFAYKAGKIRDDNVVNIVSADTITLTDDDTNYIEILPSTGVISANIIGFSPGKIPLFEVITVSAAIDTVTDKRAFIGYGRKTRGIAFYIDGALTTALKAAFIAPCNLTVVNVKMAVRVAPTDANIICDIHKNGTTIFTTQGNRPTIIATETTEDSSAPDVTSISAGDLIKLEIDQIGASVSGSDLSVTIICKEES